MGNFFGEAYPETPEQDPVYAALRSIITPSTPGVTGMPRPEEPMRFPVTPGTSPVNRAGHPSAAVNPAQRAALEKQAVIRETERRIGLEQRRAQLEAQRAADDARMSAEEAVANLEAQRERAQLDALHEFAAADQAAKAEQDKLDISAAKTETQRKQAGAKEAKVRGEAATASGEAVAAATQGVENRGNLAAPGAFARGVYDTDGAGAGAAIQGALAATADPTLAREAQGGVERPNSVQIGGQQFSAPATINTREFTYRPELVRTSTGFMGVPVPGYATRSVDNVLSAADVATLRQRQSESLAARVDALRQDMPGADAGTLVEYARSLDSGDHARIAQTMLKLPKGLATREAEQNLRNSFLQGEVAQQQLDYMKGIVAQQGRDAYMDPLAMMSLKGVQPTLGLTASGMPKLTAAGSSGGSSLGSVSNLVATALGRGSGDEPNYAALSELQVAVLQQTNGRLVMVIPDGEIDEDNNIQYRDTGEFVNLFHQAASSDPGTQQAALKALEETGMYRLVKNPSTGRIMVVSDAASKNARVAHAISNYVQAEAQIRSQVPNWVGPLTPNSAEVADAMAALEAGPPKPPSPSEALGGQIAELEALRASIGGYGINRKLDARIEQLQREKRATAGPGFIERFQTGRRERRTEALTKLKELGLE